MDALTNGRDSDLNWKQSGFTGEIPVTFRLDSGTQVDIIPQYIFNETAFIIEKSCHAVIILKATVWHIGQTRAHVTFGNEMYTVKLQIVQGDVKPIRGKQTYKHVDLMKREIILEEVSVSGHFQKWWGSIMTFFKSKVA